MDVHWSNEHWTLVSSAFTYILYVRTAVQDWLDRLMNTDLTECCGPRRSVCSPLGSSQSRHQRTRWSSTPPEPLSHRQTGSLQRGPPSPGSLRTQRATANTRQTLWITIRIELQSLFLFLETLDSSCFSSFRCFHWFSSADGDTSAFITGLKVIPEAVY